MCVLTKMMSTALITERNASRIKLSVKMAPTGNLARYPLAECPLSDSKME